MNSLSQGFSTCGVDLKTWGSLPHYSGNFWWARCDWIRSKDSECPLGKDSRTIAEFWLLREPSAYLKNGSKKGDRVYETNLTPKKAVSLWNTDIDHYHKQMPRAEYTCTDQHKHCAMYRIYTTYHHKFTQCTFHHLCNTT